MTVHLIYPYQAPPGMSEAAPWTIGRELGRALRRAGHRVIQYDWEDRRTIIPAAGDILLGHPHEEPGRVMRNSLAAGPWRGIFGLAPWNGSAPYTRRLAAVVGAGGYLFPICGRYWGERLPAEWQGRTTRLDMAVDAMRFPRLTMRPRPPGLRRVLYIGCTLPCKGTDLLAGFGIGHIGPGLIPGAVEHGMTDLQSAEGRAIVARYDFLIAPGRADANPATVLEAMGWGLVPILARTCGYVEEDVEAVWIDDGISDALRRAQLIPGDRLIEMAVSNCKRLENRFTWARFCGTVIGEISRQSQLT